VGTGPVGIRALLDVLGETGAVLRRPGLAHPAGKRRGAHRTSGAHRTTGRQLQRLSTAGGGGVERGAARLDQRGRHPALVRCVAAFRPPSASPRPGARYAARAGPCGVTTRARRPIVDVALGARGVDGSRGDEDRPARRSARPVP
jgi:hypothetical protein